MVNKHGHTLDVPLNESSERHGVNIHMTKTFFEPKNKKKQTNARFDQFSNTGQDTLKFMKINFSG